MENLNSLSQQVKTEGARVKIQTFENATDGATLAPSSGAGQGRPLAPAPPSQRGCSESPVRPRVSVLADQVPSALGPGAPAWRADTWHARGAVPSPVHPSSTNPLSSLRM